MIDKVRVELDMPCICSEEGKQDAEDLKNRIIKHYGWEQPEYFASWCVAELWHSYECTIEGMYSDMWFGVAAESETNTFFVQCDRVEDGLASILGYYMDQELSESSEKVETES